MKRLPNQLHTPADFEAAYRWFKEAEREEHKIWPGEPKPHHVKGGPGYTAARVAKGETDEVLEEAKQ